jgi:hypothetical protein
MLSFCSYIVKRHSSLQQKRSVSDAWEPVLVEPSLRRGKLGCVAPGFNPLKLVHFSLNPPHDTAGPALL